MRAQTHAHTCTHTHTRNQGAHVGLQPADI